MSRRAVSLALAIVAMAAATAAAVAMKPRQLMAKSHTDLNVIGWRKMAKGQLAAGH
jgi:opacity protein-like surface antigen